MALDEALFAEVEEGEAPPALRFYEFRPPCVTLGRGQSVSEGALEALERGGLSWALRPTGGQAVLHAGALTYAVVAPLDAHPAFRRVRSSYEILGRWLLRGLRACGVPAEAGPPRPPPRRGNPPEPVCFKVVGPWEPRVEGKKICGNAQRRGRTAFLQHGSVSLDPPSELLKLFLGTFRGGAAGEGSDPADFPGVAPWIGGGTPFRSLRHALVEAFREVFGQPLIESSPPHGGVDSLTSGGKVPTL